MKTLNEEITLDCKRDPCNVCGMQTLDGDCRHKIAELVQMKTDGDTTQRERLMQERERLAAALNVI
jgi:hypothetical protein